MQVLCRVLRGYVKLHVNMKGSVDNQMKYSWINGTLWMPKHLHDDGDMGQMVFMSPVRYLKA